MNQSAVTLTPEVRRRLFRAASAAAEPGDLLFFYHRTSWRSRWIRRITACDMPHVCVYLGKGRIVGMLRGRVRRHLLGRFFRDEYDLRFVRGSLEVRDEALRFVGKREAWLDLFVLCLLALLERAFGETRARAIVPYRMRGVTCSGVVSSAWHAAHGIEHRLDPMLHTPRDLERIVGTDSFFEARLLQPFGPSSLARDIVPGHGDG